MPAKIKPIPLRMPDVLRAKVKSYADGRGLTEHKAVLELVNKGLRAPDMGKPATDPKAVLAQAETAAAHLAKPKPKSPSRWSIQIGPITPPPGSRLKPPAKRK